MTTRERPRVGGYQWEQARPKAIAVYNGNYSLSGQWTGPFLRPWIVTGPRVFEVFPTHSEALQYALKKAGQA